MDTQDKRMYRFGPFEADLGNRQLFKNGLTVVLAGQPFDVLALLLENPGNLVTRQQLRTRLWPAGTVVEFDHGIHVAVTKLREALGDDTEHPRFIATVPRHGYRFIAPVSPLSAPAFDRFIAAASTLGSGALERTAVQPQLSEASATGRASERSGLPDEPGSQVSNPNTRTSSANTSQDDQSALPATQRRAPPFDPRLPAVITGVALVLMYVAVDKFWTPRHSATVQPVTQPAQEPKAVTAAVPARDPKTIAVLPFDNLSGRSEDAYLADGLHAEVLNTLARLREFNVISRTSTLEYKGKAVDVREIGERLGVGSILEGSIRRSGGKLRLSVQLVDTNNDRPLLAVSYDRDLGHLLDLQSTVARQVADSLVATLSRSQRDDLERVGTNNGDAYELFLKAMAHVDRPLESMDENYDVREPKRLLEAAVKLDPGYADAYAYLSFLNTAAFYFYDRRPENAVAARHAYERAFEIEPSLPEARLARGVYDTYAAMDPARGLDDLQAVVDSRPNSAQAHAMLGVTLRRLGRMDEALSHLLRASDLDPLNKGSDYQPWLTLVGLRRWREANERVEIDLRRFPDSGWYWLYRPWIEYAARNDVEPMRVALREHGGQLNAQARPILEFEIAIAEGRFLDAIHLQDVAWPPDRSGWLATYGRETSIGLLYHAAGDERRARQSFLAAERHVLESHKPGNGEELAIAQSMLGKHAEALATIDKLRAEVFPESTDAINGPETSFVRSIILVRGGHRDEAYAEVNRLLRVPFGAPRWQFWLLPCVILLVKDDPQFAELLYRSPRL